MIKIILLTIYTVLTIVYSYVAFNAYSENIMLKEDMRDYEIKYSGLLSKYCQLTLQDEIKPEYKCL